MISIVIPTYINRMRSTDRLRLTLDSFIAQNMTHKSWELIIVDDGSSVDVADFVYNQVLNTPPFNVRVIRQQHKGLCSAMNRGVSEAKNDVVLLGVDDNYAAPNAVATLLNTYQKCSKTTRAVMGNERISLFTTGLHTLIKPEVFRGIDKKEYYKKYESELQQFSDLTPNTLRTRFDELYALSISENEFFEKCLLNNIHSNYSWLCFRPGAVVIGKKDYWALNGFDEKFDPSGWYSDIDFGLKLYVAKGQLLYEKEAKFVHLNHLRYNATHKEDIRCFSYMVNKYGSFEVLLMPFLWEMKTFESYITAVEKVKEALKYTVDSEYQNYVSD